MTPAVDQLGLNGAHQKIWIDLDNSPHVPFFLPIVRELEKKGHTVFVTTRDCFQVCALADYHKLRHTCIGTHYGSNRAFKVLGTIWRALQLAPVVVREKPDISLSHGSRALVLLSSILRVPTVVMFDYEHAAFLPLLRPTLGIAPEVINDPRFARHFAGGVCAYSGLKEDVYARSFVPDSSIVGQLKLEPDLVIATLRPPAVEAHYHNPESEKLFTEVVEFLGNTANVRMIVLPRNEARERRDMERRWSRLFREGRILIPDHVVDGLNLVWHSDLVISGGGTMNREAAALGVPVYSIFRGRLGAVDAYLVEQQRLTLIRSVEDVRTKIVPVKRPRTECDSARKDLVLNQIMAGIDTAMRQVHRSNGLGEGLD